MFEVSTEFRKGVFFIRLRGRTDNEGCLDDIDPLINSIGFRVIVLNISDLINISINSIRWINNYYKRILKEKRLLYICDNYVSRDRLFMCIPKLDSEIAAFSLI